MPKHRAVARAVGEVLDRLCAGSIEALLQGMVRGKIVDREELKRLADKVAEMDPDKDGPDE